MRSKQNPLGRVTVRALVSSFHLAAANAATVRQIRGRAQNSWTIENLFAETLCRLRAFLSEK